MFKRRDVMVYFIALLVASGLAVDAETVAGLSDPTAPPSAGSPGRVTEKRQRRPLVLQSTIVSAQRRLALINSRIYREGEMVNGARLVRILPGEVVLNQSGGKIRLRLSGRPVKGERTPASEE